MNIKIRIKTIRKNCCFFIFGLMIILMGCNPENIVNKPVANFDFNPKENIKITDTIKFSNNSENSNLYLWDFGDGTISIIKEPNHVYESYGSFNVTLISTNESLSDTISKTITISEVITLNKNTSSIDVDNDGIIDFSVNINGFSGGHTATSNILFVAYNDYSIITDSVFVDHFILNIKDTLKMYTPKKFTLGDTIKSSNIFTQKSAFLASFYSQWMVSNYNMNYWISQDTKYVGYLKIVGNKSKIGWIKINVPDFYSAYLISYKIPTACDRLIIDK